MELDLMLSHLVPEPLTRPIEILWVAALPRGTPEQALFTERFIDGLDYV